MALRSLTLRRAVAALVCLAFLNAFAAQAHAHGPHQHSADVGTRHDHASSVPVAVAHAEGHHYDLAHAAFDAPDDAGGDKEPSSHTHCSHAHCCMAIMIEFAGFAPIPVGTGLRGRAYRDAIQGLPWASIDRPPIAVL